MKRRRSISLALIGAMILVMSAAEIQKTRAQETQPPPAPPRQGPPMRVACGQDMQSLCPGLVGKDARQCLRSHRGQLSAGCIAFFQEARARRAAGQMGAPPAGGPPPGPDEDKDQ